MESGEWSRQQLQERQRLLRERVEALRVDQLQEQQERLFEQVGQLQSDVAQQQKQAAELHKQVEQLVMDQRRHCEKVEAHLGSIFHPVERDQANRLLEQLERLRHDLEQVELLTVEQLQPRAEGLNRLVAQQQTEPLLSERGRLHQQLGSRVPHAFRRKRREQVWQQLHQLDLEVKQLQQNVTRLEPKVQQQQEFVTQQQEQLSESHQHLEETQKLMNRLREQVTEAASTDKDAQERQSQTKDALNTTTAFFSLTTALLTAYNALDPEEWAEIMEL